ncbi:FeoB-associated Cys-rich membrane protein [uncultured Neglectibacter sp.]|uniref:FeoB-associated Cys-rich membrane protein n=1 Tax=uncultured Neglectibacter sp. TaxID=1924108 RepID=UPI0034DF1B66
MLSWLAANWGTLLVGAVLLLIVAAVLVSLRKQKRAGGCAGCSGCSGGCSGCSSCGGRPVQSKKPFPKRS